MSPLWRKIVNSLKLILLPTIAALYLGFCWTVLYRTVLLKGHALVDASPENIATIKSAITTVNIVVIALALWPLRTLLIDLKGEEFFRSLHHLKDSGVDLVTANSLSSASLGAAKTASIILSRKTSTQFVVAFLSSLLVVIVSSLAPAALSVNERMLDSPSMIFQVGAIPPQSAVPTIPRLDGYYSPTMNMKSKLEEAATLTWSEAALNLNYSFNAPNRNFESPDLPQYIIPLPATLSPESANPAQWTTDIFVLRPACSWQITNITERARMEDFESDGGLPYAVVNLPEIDINFVIQLLGANANGNLGFDMHYSSVYPTVLVSNMLNATTGELPSGGYSIWEISQYYPNSTNPSWALVFNATAVPHFEIIDAYGGIFRFAILACSPNLTVETAQVKSTGRDLTVSPISRSGDSKSTRYGNLDHRQGELFLATLFSKLEAFTSPSIRGVSTGSQVQASLVFGWDQVKSFDIPDTIFDPGYTAEPVVWTPMPMSNITAMYARYIQSAAKPYLTGVLGTAQVPGIISRPVIAFVASRVHVIISTILLLVLNVISLVVHVRPRKGEVFSLLTVASVLHESNVTAEMAKFRRENLRVGGEELEREFEVASRNRVLKLDERLESVSGIGVLAILNDDSQMV